MNRFKVVFRTALILLTVTVNIGCDQATKTIVRQRIGYGDTLLLLDRHLTLTRVENTGAFLSLGTSLPPILKTLLLIGLPMAMLLAGLLYLLIARNVAKLPLLGGCFVVGGGIGNLFDRVRYGSVTDFLHLQAGVFQTGIFNAADVSIMVGTGILLVYSLLRR
jgi:signal peptidase II